MPGLRIRILRLLYLQVVDNGRCLTTISDTHQQCACINKRKQRKGHYKGEDVYAALGRTNAGRYLTVIFIYKLDHRALINTARNMTTKERKRYGRKR